MIPSRKRPQFRYDDDQQEVHLLLSKEEAYAIADALIQTDTPNGLILQTFLEGTEEERP